MTIYLQGDLHGDLDNIKDCLAQIENPKEEDIIIVCGDASLEYGKYNMGSCKKIMSKFPGTWLILRGNHDCRYWRKHTINIPDGLAPAAGWDFSEKFGEITLYQKKYPNIHYIDDCGGIYDINGYNCLFFPGAYSVDRAYRLTNDLPYEFEEQLTLTEFQDLNKQIMLNKENIDFIFSHTAPLSCEELIKYLFIANINQATVDKTTEKYLDIVVNEIPNFKHFFFGHYHDDKELNDKYTILYKKVVRLEDYV